MTGFILGIVGWSLFGWFAEICVAAALWLNDRFEREQTAQGRRALALSLTYRLLFGAVLCWYDLGRGLRAVARWYLSDLKGSR